MLMQLLQFAAGVALLVLGADWLVKGASRLARAFGVSSLVVGLTVVAFGTSAPELAVSLNAARQGTAEIAVGNVVGSNIANLLLILGLSALIAPLLVNRQIVRQEMPVLIAATVLTIVFLLDGTLVRWEGGVLFVFAVVYTCFLVRQARRQGAAAAQADDESGQSGEATPASAQGWLLNIGFILAGLAGLVFGADLLVAASVAVARQLGVSELVIGLTIVAVGTSVPEIATSLVAILKGERDLAVGNVVGSNLFNLLVVLGLSAVFAPAGIPVPLEAMAFDVWFMLISTLLCLPLMIAGSVVSRGEGALLLGWYVLYVLWLVLSAKFGTVPPVYRHTVCYALLPATAALVLWQLVRRSRTTQAGR